MTNEEITAVRFEIGDLIRIRQEFISGFAHWSGGANYTCDMVFRMIKDNGVVFGRQSISVERLDGSSFQQPRIYAYYFELAHGSNSSFVLDESGI